MPVTDVEQLVRQALVTILKADAGFQAAIGRGAAADIVIERAQFVPGQVLPVLAYDLDGFQEDGPCTLVLSAVADEPEASAKCRDILRAAVAALTSTAFTGQSLDVVIYGERRASVELSEEDRSLFNRMGQPSLQQADALLTLHHLV